MPLVPIDNVAGGVDQRAMSPDDQELRALLRLTRTHGLGTAQLARLIERHGTATDAVDALMDLGRGTVRLATRDTIEREIDATLAAGAGFLCHGDAAYPAPLAAIEQAPRLLTIKGDPAALTGRLVGMVGARNASAGGRKLACEIATELAGEGFTIASGLARGIDTAAHAGAITRGLTVAVIATGIDVVYPAENAALAAAIAESGCIVTERPFGAGPQASQFPRRNRLISALSEALLVVEAAVRSGSLITARYAADQGREVMAVPGTPLDERHRGTNRLLREGAHFVECAADVVAALTPFEVKAEPHARPGPPARTPPAKRARERPLAATPMSPPVPEGELEAALRERLAVEPVAVDELIRQCHASPSQVQKALLELELSGEIERHAGNRVSRVVL